MREATILARSLLPTLSSTTPLQLFLLDFGGLFFHSGITVAWSHSVGQVSVKASGWALRVWSHNCCTKEKTCVWIAMGAHFSISTVTPSSPGALPIFIWDNAF